MKKIIPSLLALSLVAAFSAQAATPKDTLVIAQSTDDADSFDPAQGFELTTVQAFTNIYQRLVQSDPTNPTDLKPTLATSWTPGSDNRSLTFELRKGAQFASGNPLRPEDVIFSLGRVVKLNLDPSFIMTQLGWNKDNVDTFLKKSMTTMCRSAGAPTSARPMCLACCLHRSLRLWMRKLHRRMPKTVTSVMPG